MAGKSDSLVFGVNRCTLSGPRSKQERIRETARFFAQTLRAARMGAQKWSNLNNKHFQRVVDQMRGRGAGDGRIAEVLSAARHVCRAYGNEHVSLENTTFGVHRGTIANPTTKAADPEKVAQVLQSLRMDTSYVHAPRAAAQIELMYQLGLRREEAAKVDLVNDWNRIEHTLLIQHGTKGGRPRVLEGLSEQQETALKRAEAFASPSNRKGVYNLMPQGMGDEWLHRVDYAARTHGMTKKEMGFTLHGCRHERFRKMYHDHCGFLPPNCHPSRDVFQEEAQKVAGTGWAGRDAEARDQIEAAAGHSPGRRDISNAYLGSSK
ncbi:MAG TPA: hypothetical protein DDZ34_00150 [Syntrophaceae bacterium]|nr:hypothetical protein [Syntrophaceae bacterium]